MRVCVCVCVCAVLFTLKHSHFPQYRFAFCGAVGRWQVAVKIVGHDQEIFIAKYPDGHWTSGIGSYVGIVSPV
jgi:hypothetical protein